MSTNLDDSQDIMQKFRWYIYDGILQKIYLNHTYPKEYLALCQPMFEKLKEGGEVFLFFWFNFVGKNKIFIKNKF